MPNQVVSLNTAVSPYEADQAAIQQRQQLANLLQQQALQPSERFSYNGIEAVGGAKQGASKLAQLLASLYAQKSVGDDQRALSQKAQTDASNWITKLTQGSQAQPEVPGSVQSTPADVEDRQQGIDMGTGASPMTSGQAIPVPGGQGEGANVGTPAVAGGPLSDSQRMAVLMQGMSNPLTSQMAGPMAMQEMQRQRLMAALGMGQSPGSLPTQGGVPMAGGGAPGAPQGGQAPSGPAVGGPAGGIPMAVWLATDPSGAKYMEQLAKDTTESNKPVVNRGFGLGRVVNGQYVPDPASMGQIGEAVGAQERAKFPFSEVTTPGGAKVPAFTVPGLVPPGSAAPPPTPTLTPTAPLAANPAPAVASQPIAPPKTPVIGQTTADKTAGEEQGKSGVDYDNKINDAAAGAVTQNRMLDELSNSLQDMNPGKLAAVSKSIAEWKVGLGIADDNDKKIAASSEVTDKLTGQLVSSALKSMTARPTQAEFQIFLNKFVPNMNMTPQGASQVIGFMRQANNLNAQKQADFQEWKKTQPVQNWRNFESVWNQKLAAAPLGSGSSWGTTGDYNAPAPKTMNWNDLPKAAQ